MSIIWLAVATSYNLIITSYNPSPSSSSPWKKQNFPNRKLVFSKEVDFPDRHWWHLYIPPILDSRERFSRRDCQFWMEILHFRILYSGRFLRHIGFPLLDSTFESFLLNYKVVVQSFRLKLNLLFALSFCRFCERQKSTQVGIYIWWGKITFLNL